MIVLLGRIILTCIKLFLLLVVTAMIKFQIPELRYDFGTKEPISIKSPEELSTARSPRSVFASVRGKADFTKAATFSKYGVRYTYFLLTEYGDKLIVRTLEEVGEDWAQIDFHVGRLRPFNRMPFSRSVRAGFRKHHDVGIPENAFFLARDDAPIPNGWSIGAVIFASVLWCVLVYFFFIHCRIFTNHGTRRQRTVTSPES